MIISRTVLGSILVGTVILALLCAKTFLSRTNPGVSFHPILQARFKGNPAAKLKIVTFTDFQCPACALAEEVIETLLKEYEGQIYLEHKHFPLPMHPFAQKASLYAECAAEQGKFWPFHSVLFKTQKTWSKMTSVDSYFSELAVSLGVDGVKLVVCMKGEEASSKVYKDMAEGTTLQVRSTPTFFVNNRIAVGGAQLKALVEELLGKK